MAGRYQTGAVGLRGLVRSLSAVAACFSALIAADGLTAAARAETRTLEFKQLHTGETLTVTFKRNGRYDTAALKKINYILRDWRRNESTTMDPKLLDLVWEVRKSVGSTAPIYVLSGYRSPVTNAMLRSRSSGVAKFSQHMAGKALDFYIPGVPLSKLRETGLKYQTGGVGYYPTSGSPFVHLDTGSVRHWPRMTRSQLAKLFPDGKTVHIPSDGKPMPGYDRAVAELNRGITTRMASLSGGTRQQAVVNTSRLDPSVPVTAASTGGGGRNLIAALFDSGEDGDEEDASGRNETPAASPTPAAPVKPTVVASLETAPATPPARAPIPRVKPVADIPASAIPATVAAADTPLPAPRPTLVAVVEPAAEASEDTPEQPAVAIAEAPLPESKPLLTASLQPTEDTGAAVAALPRQRPLLPAGDVIASLIDETDADPISTATALASQDSVAAMPPFAATFTGQQVPLRDGPVLVAIDYRPDALKPYLNSGTCLRDSTFVTLRHPDQTDIGSLTTLTGPVIVNRFAEGPQLVYPMRRFSGPAVAPVATRTYQLASSEPEQVSEEFTTGAVARATTLR